MRAIEQACTGAALCRGLGKQHLDQLWQGWPVWEQIVSKPWGYTKIGREPQRRYLKRVWTDSGRILGNKYGQQNEESSRWMVLKHESKPDCWGPPLGFSESRGLEQGQRMCASNKYPTDANATGSGTQFWGSQPRLTLESPGNSHSYWTPGLLPGDSIVIGLVHKLGIRDFVCL